MIPGLNWLRFIPWIAAIAAAIILYSMIRKDAADDVRQAIDRQNNEAGNAADLGADSFLECRDLGGVFDFATGKCTRP